MSNKTESAMGIKRVIVEMPADLHMEFTEVVNDLYGRGLGPRGVGPQARNLIREFVASHREKAAA